MRFRGPQGWVQAVDGLSLQVNRGEVLGIVGESGSGKSVTQLALMGLIPKPPGEVSGAYARFEGRDLLKMRAGELQRLRGDRVAMIFQDPMTSLNPFLRVSTQMTEVLIAHNKVSSKAEAHRKAIEMLQRVGMPGAVERIHHFPHQFSGGMRQRVMIAMALLCNPALLIADEPTTALDVTIQAQILDLMRQLRRDFETGVILITHDLGVVAGMAERVLVMYAGQVVEEAPVRKLFQSPGHPYTVGLMRSIPRLDIQQPQLIPITGMPPDLSAKPSGCAFHPRCPFAQPKCKVESPPWVSISDDHRARCWFPTA